jgi:maleylacetate reductase
VRSFALDFASPRVIFGAGSVSVLPDEIERLGSKRLLVLCSREQRAQAEAITGTVSDRVVGCFDRAKMHVPIEVASAAGSVCAELKADLVVAIGGGSTVGLAKILSMRLGMPSLVIPTTYAGSEVTTIWGLTENGVKRTGRNAKVLPKTVIYDPLQTIDLPLSVTVSSAFNAIAHAAEGLYSSELNPLLEVICEKGIGALLDAIPRLVSNRKDVEAREDALFGSWMSGIALSHLGMGLHHKLCHTLGGSLDLPHAETHAVVLPHVLAYNLPYARSAERALQKITGQGDAPGSLYDLARRSGLPMSLSELGMRIGDIRVVRDLVLQDQYPNPRPLEREALDALLSNAFHGRAPTSLGLSVAQ